MLSKKTKYALHALLHLASWYRVGKPVLIGKMAQDERIPKKFLELILLELKNKGFLLSKKGKGGGYQLSKSPGKIKMGEIVRAVEGPIALLPCVSQTAYQKCDECVSEEHCGIRMVMSDVREATSKILDGTTLADVLEKTENARNKESKAMMFHI